MGDGRRTCRFRERACDLSLALSLILCAATGGGHRWGSATLVVLLPALAFGLVWPNLTRYRVPLPAWILLGLSAWSVFQALPLPDFLLAVTNPRWSELRAFLGLALGGSSSYEPAQSAVYGLWWAGAAAVATAAHARQARSSHRDDVLRWVAWAGLASLVAGLSTRWLGLERVLGLVPTSRPANQLLSAFANPNHGGAYLALAALCALGVAIESERSRRGGGYGLLAVTLLAGSIAHASRSASALLVLALLGIAVTFRGGSERRTFSIRIYASLVFALACLMLAIAAAPRVWLKDFGRFDDPLGVGLKVAALEDSLPLILDHPFFGIGRGAYRSVYPAYKTSSFQLTFSHPENMAVQFVAEWGLVVGGFAFIGAVAFAIQRLLRAERGSSYVAAFGVVALIIQNLVDFSLELPAVLFAVVAVLAGSQRLTRTQAMGRWVFLGGFVSVVAAGASMSTGPGLDEDLARTEAGVEDLRNAILRHPSHPVLRARLAYALEQSDPSRLNEALEEANRTLLLAPTYADAHLLAGRILVRLGAREQGLEAMGGYLRLRSDADSVRTFLSTVLTCARSEAELMMTLPAGDLLTGQPEPQVAAAVARGLASSSRSDWTATVVRATINQAGFEDLTQLGRAAFEASQWGLAVQAFRRAQRMEGAVHPRLRWAALQSLSSLGRHAEAIALADDGVTDSRVLLAGLDAALAQPDLDAAQRLLRRLRSRQASSRPLRIAYLERKARLSMLVRRPTEALRSLDQALTMAPGRVQLRLARARMLLDLGRSSQALRDLELVLRAEPEHPEALELRGLVASKSVSGRR